MMVLALVASAFAPGFAACGGDDDGPPGVDAAGAADAGVDAQDPRFDELGASIEAERVGFGAPGVAVAVLVDGELKWAAGFGQVGPERSDPVQPTTLFRLASVTKMLTATALLQLVASGEVNLDAPVTDVLPGFALAPSEDTASSIRVRDLLTHSTGMFDYLAIDAPGPDSDLQEVLVGPTFANSVIMMAPAGRMYNYSNPNFMVAGLIVESERGIPYRQAMHDLVFAPLGMDRTFFLPSDVLADGDYASGKA
jgi:CubicO group peptidase (beta-lactamase class C family)